MIAFGLIFLLLHISFVNSLIVLPSIHDTTINEASIMLTKPISWHRNDDNNDIVPALLNPLIVKKLCKLILAYHPVFHLAITPNSIFLARCFERNVPAFRGRNINFVLILLCYCPRPMNVTNDYFLVKGPTYNSVLIYTWIINGYLLVGYAYDITDDDLRLTESNQQSQIINYHTPRTSSSSASSSRSGSSIFQTAPSSPTKL